MAGFTIPDEVEAAFAPQARLFQTDLEILALAHGDSGVMSGCAVTAQGSPDMTVAVAAGVVKSLATRLTVTGGNATITTADGTNPRLDVVVVTSGNALAVRAGTPAASPLLPALTAGDVPLARVYIPASDTTIASNQIVDARVLLADLTASQVGTALGYTPVGPLDLVPTEQASFESGVVTGCAVTPSSGMTLAVAAGVVRAGGKRGVIEAATTVTIPTAHATLPRIDLVFVNSAGAVAVRSGTAAASPVPPTMPAPGQTIAGDSGTTTNINNAISDSTKSWATNQWRGWTVKVSPSDTRIGEHYRPIVSSSTTFVTMNRKVYSTTPTSGTPYEIFLSDAVILSSIYIPAADTTIDAAQITDERVIIRDSGEHNVLAYYAKGDEVQNDRDSIQQAIWAAGSAGGGTVLVPRPDTWIDSVTGTATSGNSSSLTDSGKSWTVNQWAGYYVRVTGGTGRGQTHKIMANTATALTIQTSGTLTPGFTINPDSTSTYAIGRLARYRVEMPSGDSLLQILQPNVHLVGQPGAAIYTPTLESNYCAVVIRGNREVAKTTVTNFSETNTATSGTTTTLTRSTASWTVNALAGLKVTINSGTNAGQSRQVISNTATQLTVDRAFNAAIDNTSNYTVRHLPRAAGILTVGSTAGLGVDDFIAVRSSGEVFNDERPTTDFKGEFQRIRSISGSQIYLAGGTYDSYDTTTYTVNIDRYSFLENVEVRNIEFVGDNSDLVALTTNTSGNTTTTLQASGSPGWTVNAYAKMTVRYFSGGVQVTGEIASNTANTLTFNVASLTPDNSTAFTVYRAQECIVAQFVRDFRVNRCRIRGYKRAAVMVVDSVQVSVLDCDVRGANEDGLGYGVLLGSVDGGLVSGGHFTDGRHGFDVSESPFTAGATGNSGVVARNVTLRDIIAYDHRAGGVSTHGGAEIITISGCKISNSYGGIGCRSRFTNIIDNHIYGMTQVTGAGSALGGIIIGETKDTVGNGGIGLRIIGNYIDATPDNTATAATYGILCGTYLQDSLIEGNRIVGQTGEGMWFQGNQSKRSQIINNYVDGANQASGRNGIRIEPWTAGNGNNQDDLRISGNVFTNIAAACITIVGNSTNGSPSDSIQITDNIFSGHGTQAIILTSFFKQVEVSGNQFVDASGVSGNSAKEAVNITAATLIDPLRFSNNLVGKTTDDVTGTASAGAAATLTSQAITSVATDQYAGYTIRTIGGTGPGQVRTIVGHTSGTTPVFTVNANWSVNPASGTTYAIYKGTPVYNPIPFTFGPWTVINQGASATTEALLPQMATATTVALYATTQNDIRMDRSGRVVGAIIQSNAAIASGTVTLRVRKTPTNGAVVNHVFAADACQLTSAITPNDSAFNQLGVPFAAGEKIGVAFVSASLSPTTAELQAWLIIQVDAF